MSADINMIAGSPESQSNVSAKSVEVPSNKHESISESHTPPLPMEKPESPPATKRRKSRFEDAPPHESDKVGNQIKTERIKPEEKQTSKKSNEWDMFAEADNIGDFNVRFSHGAKLLSLVIRSIPSPAHSHEISFVLEPHVGGKASRGTG